MNRRFKVNLRPESFGSEHEHEALRQVDGKVVEVVEDLGRSLFRTTFRPVGEFPDSDYVQGGFLLVMPDRDGTWVEPRKGRGGGA